MLKSWGTRAAAFATGTAVVSSLVFVGSAGAVANNRCESINGVVKYSFGTARCESTMSTGKKANVAKAVGANAYADAERGNGNKATATGNSAVAIASIGENNVATAIGTSAGAAAQNGVGNKATANGDIATALAINGDHNTATARGRSSSATAQNGNHNRATSVAGGTATAQGGTSTAQAKSACVITENANQKGSCP